MGKDGNRRSLAEGRKETENQTKGIEESETERMEREVRRCEGDVKARDTK